MPESKGRILEDKADEEMKDDSLEKENLPNYKVPSKFLLGAEFDFEITGKVVKSRRRGKQVSPFKPFRALSNPPFPSFLPIVGGQNLTFPLQLEGTHL